MSGGACLCSPAFTEARLFEAGTSYRVILQSTCDLRFSCSRRLLMAVQCVST